MRVMRVRSDLILEGRQTAGRVVAAGQRVAGPGAGVAKRPGRAFARGGQVHWASGGDVIMTISTPDDRGQRAQDANEAIREGAIRWLLWLRNGHVVAREFDAFERWCAQSVEHAAAVYDVMWLWAMLGMLDAPEQDGAAEPDGTRRVH